MFIPEMTFSLTLSNRLGQISFINLEYCLLEKNASDRFELSISVEWLKIRSSNNLKRTMCVYYIKYSNSLTLCILMGSSNQNETMNLGWFIVYNEGSPVIIYN